MILLIILRQLIIFVVVFQFAELENSLENLKSEI